MALKTYKPSTPGLRQLAIVDRSELYKGKPLKTLTEGKSEKGGRNNAGRITVRFRGGGHKQSYRLVDFKRRKTEAAKVERLEYDPNRSAFIALIKYSDGEQSYIIAPQRLSVGDEVVSGQNVDVKPGNAMPLGSIPVGTIVHNVELKIGKGGAVARSAGTYAQIVGVTFGVYNGHKHIPVALSEEMIGHKFGEFAPTRTFHGHSADRKAKRATPGVPGAAAPAAPPTPASGT